MSAETEPREDENQRDSPKGTPGEAGRMSFLEHLDELRKRLVRSALAVLLGLVVCWFFSEEILRFLLKPIEDAMGTLAVIRPAEAFMNRVKAAFVGSIFLSLPIIVFQAWSFVAPGLFPREKRWVLPVIFTGSLLFLVGAGFCYVVAMPAAVNFLAEMGEGYVSNITLDYAFGFATKLLLGLGLVFEMPLVVFALARLGMVSGRFLWKKIDIAVFLCFLVAAVITPTPDVMTMSLFALPMVLLYLISIGVAWVAGPKEPREEKKA